MTPDRIPFGKPIEVVQGQKGVVRIAGERVRNPVKRISIPADQLDNLRALTVRAYIAQTGDSDSAGQSHLDEEMKKMNLKFRGEQPEEVWRRTLATIMGGGVSIKEIAAELLNTSPDDLKAVWMGESSHQNRDEVIMTLSKEIIRYWPSSPNRA